MPLDFMRIEALLSHPGMEAKGLVATGSHPDIFLPVMLSSRARHLIQSDRPDFETCRRRANAFETSMPATCEELEAAVLTGTSASNYDFKFATADEKERAISLLLKTAQSVSALSVWQTQLRIIAEELVLNALYSSVAALKDLTGSIYAFSSSAPCRLRLSFDSERLLISCHDPVGSLSPELLLRRMSEVFGRSLVRVESRLTGTPGLGCALMLRTGTDFFRVQQENEVFSGWCGAPA